MDNGLTGLIGLCRKAGKTEVGDEPVSIAARTHKARLILMAADAAENTLRHGESLGALTDVGFAAAIVKKLAQQEPEHYQAALQKLSHKAEKTLRRQKERRAREKAEKNRRPWAAPPSGKKPS